MILPLLSEVIAKSATSKDNRIFRNYEPHYSEIKKIDSFLINNKPYHILDTEHNYQLFLLSLDKIFGKFKDITKEKVTFRGKLEFKNFIKDSDTKEKQAVFILSDPRALYRNSNNSPIFLRVPFSNNLISGSYVEVDVFPNSMNDQYLYFVQPENIKQLNIELNIPMLFMDYSKFNDVFRLDYGFDLSDTAQKYKRNLELSNTDLLLLNKIAGENFLSEVKGGVNCNLIKTSHNIGTYELEVIDHFLNKITFNHKTKTVFNANLVNAGNIKHFDTILKGNNRQMLTTSFKNYYGCNIGFTLNKSLNIEKDKFIEKLPNTCIDYINPIGNITTTSKSVVNRLLKLDKDYIYSSRALLLETQLLPIKMKVSEIKNTKPNILRVATMLNKFENCIDHLGTDEILTKIKIDDKSIADAKRFLHNNRDDINDFININ